MERGDLLAAAVANLIGWHETSVRALGFSTQLGDRWWTSPTPGPWIYFTAVERRPATDASIVAATTDELRAHLDDPRGSFEAVCVSFSDVDLADEGLALRTRGLWYARPPDIDPQEPDDHPSDLEITEVTGEADLVDFEVATCEAFSAPAPVTPFEIHAPGILDDARMHVLIGRRSGAVVASAMAYVDSGVVGIYGVGTRPGNRRQGYGGALTRAALAIAPDLPATLQPSPAAARLYRGLGFCEIGAFTHWG